MVEFQVNYGVACTSAKSVIMGKQLSISHIHAKIMTLEITKYKNMNKDLSLLHGQLQL